MLDARLPLSLDEVDGFFRSRLFGQPEALSVVTNLLVATKAGLARGGKPIASMLLIGPTGVGKTETAKALAELMFGDPRRMIRIDMSEYADPAAVLRLLGDLGGDEGVLIGAVRAPAVLRGAVRRTRKRPTPVSSTCCCRCSEKAA